MLTYLWVALGGALGSVARYAFTGVVANHYGKVFPLGTLVVNVTGSFIIGFFATMTGDGGRWFVRSSFRDFFMIGVCGGYTTFSSFSRETLNLAQDGEWLYAGANVLLSVMACLVAVWLGHVLAMSLNSMKGS